MGMVEAKGLTKRYPRALAVQDLSFTVQAGEVGRVRNYV